MTKLRFHSNVTGVFCLNNNESRSTRTISKPDRDRPNDETRKYFMWRKFHSKCVKQR